MRSPFFLALLVGCCAAATAPEWQVSLQRAVSLHQGGDLPGSSIHYSEALSLNPDLRRSWPVLTNYALSLQSSAPAEAAEIFREVIKLAPGADAYFNLGNALVDAGEHVEAEEALVTCLQLNPTDAEAYYTLASARLQQLGGAEKTAAAVEAVRASIALEPADGKAWVSLGDGCAPGLGSGLGSASGSGSGSC